MIARIAKPSGKLNPAVALFILLLAAAPAAFSQASSNASHASDDEALKAVVAGFSAGWNNHDAHAMLASVADDVKWVSWGGGITPSRQKVEDDHAKLFVGTYKDTHRTDVVKSIEYLTPTLAMVDDYWTMTGALRPDGSDWPYRAGYISFLIAKRGDRWIITELRTADFNAKAPPAK